MGMRTLTAFSAVLGALFLGIVAGHYATLYRESLTTQTDFEDLRQELAEAKEQIKYHEQDAKDWEAADAAFLQAGTFFHRQAKPILDSIVSKYAAAPPTGSSTAAYLKTNLGAEVHIYTNGTNVTSATVSFTDNNREHGLDVVEIVAGYLVGPKRDVKDTVSFASLLNPRGVILYRYEGAIVGTSTKERGAVTVNFTPTRNK